MTKAMFDKLGGIAAGANVGVVPNTAITGATKTKITYDSKGLVTSGTDATTADIADSTDKRYVTDANLIVIGNTSGTNSGDNATNTQYSGLAASKEDVANKSTSVSTDGTSNTKYPTVKAVKDYADALIGAADAMVFKGVTDCSTNPDYPAGTTGDFYKVSVAGKIGGASGAVVQVGDAYICTADNAGGTQAAVGASWSVMQGNTEQATTTVLGTVILATQAEAQAKSDTSKAVTPSALADFARKVTGTIGNGTLTDLPVTHGLGTQYVTAQVFDAGTNALVECDVVLTSSTITTFTFAVAPTTNQYRYVIVG